MPTSQDVGLGHKGLGPATLEPVGRWQNFSIWRGKLPHWRADDVVYFATFRHRRPLSPKEQVWLYDMLRRPDGRQWDLVALSVAAEDTEILFRVREAPKGEPYELSDIVERAKTRAGRKIIKESGERFPPFYTESYDRIVRDDAELEERILAVIDRSEDPTLAITFVENEID